MEFGDLVGYKTGIFNVYIKYRKQDKLTFIIRKNNNEKIPKKAVWFFKFKASIEKGYEHPIPVLLENRDNPVRTLIDIDPNKDEGTFYIKSFSKCV